MIATDYIFGKTSGAQPLAFNTFIGGAFPDILTAADLALRLRVTAADIQNFENTGTEIKAKVLVDYEMTSGFNFTPIIYFIDNEGRCKAIQSSFNTTSKLTFVHLPGLVEIKGTAFSASAIYQIYLPALTKLYWYQTFRGSNIRLIYLPEVTDSSGDGLNGLLTFQPQAKVIYMPKSLKIGWQTTHNDVFNDARQGVELYLNTALQTSNGGAEEGDVAYARTTKAAVINYGITNTSFILKPDNITSLSIGEIYSSAIKLEFIPPASTWPIKFYQVYVDGLLRGTFNAGNNVFATGLTAETSYNFAIRAIDDYGNVTDLSNTVSATTLNSALEPFPIGGLLSTYNLEETTPGAAVLDAWGSSNGNQGTANINQPGKINLCYGFTGGNKTFTIPNPGITTKGTFNVWVKLDLNQPTQANSGFVFLNNSNSSDHYPYSGGTIYCGIFTSARKTIGAGIIADKTQWHMITVTADEETNQWKYYQNAQLVTTSTVGVLGALPTMTFGKSRDNFHMEGWIDIPTFYSIALTQGDINKLFNQGNGIKI